MNGNELKNTSNARAISYETGRWPEAERELRRATEIDPSRGEWHALLGTALDALGRMEEALGSLRQAAALMPDDEETPVGCV